VWLRLLRPYFGPVRDFEKNRENSRMRSRAKRVKLTVSAVDLYEAFNIKPPEENYETSHRTILAGAAWPYQRTAGVCGVSV
jgi:hypothetical protein